MACGLLTPGQQAFASHYATLMLTTEALASDIPKEESSGDAPSPARVISVDAGSAIRIQNPKATVGTWQSLPGPENIDCNTSSSDLLSLPRGVRSFCAGCSSFFSTAASC